MYFMGHAALGLLLGIPFVLGRRGTRMRDPWGLTPGLVLLFVLSANVADAAHYGDLRMWTHNLVAVPVLGAVLAMLARRPMGLDRIELAAVIVAGLAHPIGDIAFGSYFPLFPFDSQAVGIAPWSAPEDFVTEAPLAAFALLVLYHPALAGRSLTHLWTGRDDVRVRLGVWAVVLLLVANFAVFLTMILAGGDERGPVALLLFMEGIAMGVPFLRLGMPPRPRPAAGRRPLRGRTRNADHDSPPPP